MQDLLKIMRQLRDPQDGCPWDKSQTHLSLRPYLLEEAAEAVDAIDGGNSQEICGELGDVLLQVAFHSVIAEQAGTFDYAAVENKIVNKLVHRHPHIFAPADTRPQVANNEQLWQVWQQAKASEQAAQSPRTVSQQIPVNLGALARQQKTHKLLGSDTPPLQEAWHQLEQAPSQQNLGQMLAALVAWADEQQIDAETALRAHTTQQLHIAESSKS